MNCQNLLLWQTVCMNCQNLFSGKKNIYIYIDLLSADLHIEW